MRFTPSRSNVGPGLIIGCMILALGVQAGCGTLAVTEEPTPSLPQKPIPARLGVHVTGEALKRAFADPDRRKLGLAPGQYFTDVILLPPETRYIAPQDILDQFGADLILQLQITDTKSSGDMNAIFFAAMPLTFFEPLAPIMSYEVTVTMEANLRDARTGRLLWAKTEPTLATDHFSPIGPEEKMAGLAQRGLHNAVVRVFETLKQELAAYQPGAVPKLAGRIGSSAALSQVQKELKELEEQERQLDEQKKEEQKRLAAVRQQIEEKKKRIEEEKRSRVGGGAALSQAEKELKALEEQERQVEEQKKEQVKLAAIQQQIEEKKRRILEEEKKKRERVKANRYAIVMGIEQYRERIPKADFAVQDAKDVAQFLTAQAGYREENVILRLNEQATKSDMEKYFEAWLKNNVDANASLLIYFSGHGAPQAATGDAYLVPYDGDPAFIEQTGYPLKRLYLMLDKLPTKNVVVMLDSCFSGAGGRSVLAKGARPMVLTVEGLASSAKAVVLAATSGSHLSLADQEKGHGLFTYYALQGLAGDADANGDGAIDVQELFEYLKPQVQRVARRTYNTEQVPQLIVPPALATQAPPRLVELR
ncbi:MAG: caspase family protein [Nitrospirota bacterium]